ADPNNISIGNPFLDPERVDQIELAYNTFIKGIVLNGAIYYRRTSDLIESFLTVDTETNVGQTTFLNIGEQENIGGNIFLSFRLWERLQLRGSFNIFNYSATGIRNGQQLSREAIIWNGNIGGSFDLGNEWAIETFGFFRSRDKPYKDLERLSVSLAWASKRTSVTEPGSDFGPSSRFWKTSDLITSSTVPTFPRMAFSLFLSVA
ncbi:MAG: TonB-dependent receptor, partial [Bacteroidota bacterium]